MGAGRGKGRGGRGGSKSSTGLNPSGAIGGEGDSSGSGAMSVVVGEEGEASAVRLRVDGSDALGALIARWPLAEGGEVASGAIGSLLKSTWATHKQVGPAINPRRSA